MSRILNFTEASNIAIHSMIYIAQQGTIVNVVQIAEEIGASKHHVAKIMQKLVQEKFVKSIRGPKGGFILTEGGAEASFYEIYKTLEGEIEIKLCPAENKFCPSFKCIIGIKGKIIVEEFVKFMSEEKLKKYVNRDSHYENLYRI